MDVLPKVISNNVVTDPGYTMAIIFVIVAFDPIVRSIIYIIIWFRKKWFKYVRKVS
ncbi:hypothetical protein [Mesoplasma melaleucae]|uniref:hypothetical protein n=1 Tax=Mesoplasma melaleucae TaxID=81459 RepID=UPI000AF96C10|nr:hypothetical protein [Mesoplasma melaleucae]